jgi:hypothetical protein
LNKKLKVGEQLGEQKKSDNLLDLILCAGRFTVLCSFAGLNLAFTSTVQRDQIIFVLRCQLPQMMVVGFSGISVAFVATVEI